MNHAQTVKSGTGTTEQSLAITSMQAMTEGVWHSQPYSKALPTLHTLFTLAAVSLQMHACILTAHARHHNRTTVSMICTIKPVQAVLSALSEHTVLQHYSRTCREP